MAGLNKNLYYKIEGQITGKTVVLLHGFLGSSEIWNEMLPYFASKFKVILFDLPGHGKSETEDEVILMKKTASQIISILKSNNVSEAHFIGHSMGGYVSLEVLDQYSEMVESVTLLNSTAKEDSIQKKADRLLAVKVFDRSPSVFINAAIENLFYEPSLLLYPAEVNRMQEIALKTSIEGAKGSLRGMRERKDFVTLISKTEVPIHIVAGRFDNTVLYSTILEQVTGTNVVLTTLETGHMSFIESFDECKDAMIKFIENCP